ncbi:MAG: HAD-IA family hydrolase [Acidimicrobiia bacterium]|nr:HAD-IA family hydrolase [Acidimicrobiia bacterium]
MVDGQDPVDSQVGPASARGAGKASDFRSLVGQVEVMVFDLGGVLLETAGLPPVLPELVSPRSSVDADSFTSNGRTWTRAELWQRWITARATDEFESGLIDADLFANRLIDELDLGVTPNALLARMAAWLTGPLPGAIELLAGLRHDYPALQLACFSNSNPIHWPLKEQWLGAHLDIMLGSHLLGVAKPHHRAFAAAAAELQAAPDRIGFVDDNQINVTAATAAGWNALHLVGVPKLGAPKQP